MRPTDICGWTGIPDLGTVDDGRGVDGVVLGRGEVRVKGVGLSSTFSLAKGVTADESFTLLSRLPGTSSFFNLKD
jgi:hypothetical protein